MAITNRSLSSPPLSIGMPVHNGENFLAAALDSLLSQTFGDFELIISDNASTDATPEICRAYAARDSRVRCLRQPENAGAAANFRRAFHAGSSQYFKWAAHDDLHAPDYLQQCLEVLEHDEKTVLCHSQVEVIDENGLTIRYDPVETQNLDSELPSERFSALIRSDLDNYEVFGVIRRQVLAKTPLIAGYIASDRPLRAELGLRGKFRVLENPLFRSRDHRARSIRLFSAHHRRGHWFDPRRRGRIVFPHWRILAEYYKSIGRVDGLSAAEKLKSRLALLRWPAVHQNWARLLADPLLAIFPGMEGMLIRGGNLLKESGRGANHNIQSGRKRTPET
ncbi:MAG TPA: glycosyltransferase family 2 protein [Desulfobulbaceae bacterium]|nr:glycosyltransferase family 2 protein [Desulfobulbaceae bacterium]